MNNNDQTLPTSPTPPLNNNNQTTTNQTTTSTNTITNQIPILDGEDPIVIQNLIDKLKILTNVSSKNKFKFVEDLCQSTIQYISGTKDTNTNLNEKIYSSTEMLNAGLLPLDINFNIRFSRKWDPTEKIKKNNSIFGLGALINTDYENITSEKILFAPIKDICLIQRGDTIPEGFYRISRTPGNKKADLNTGSGGNHLYICIKKDSKSDLPPITSLVVIYPDKKEYVPPGYSVVKRGGKPCNLNSGTNAERIYLCYKRDNTCNPIIDLQIYFPTKNESIPTSFSKIIKSTRNFPVDLNMGTGAQPIGICIKYSISNLNFLICDYDSPDSKFDFNSIGCNLPNLRDDVEDSSSLSLSKSRRSLDRRLSAQSSLGDTDDKDIKKVEVDRDLEDLNDEVLSETRTPRFMSDDTINGIDLKDNSNNNNINNNLGPYPVDQRTFSNSSNLEKGSDNNNNNSNEIPIISKRHSTGTIQDSDLRHNRRESGEGSLAEGGYLIEDDNVSVSGQSVADFDSPHTRSHKYVVTISDEPIPISYGYILRAILSGLFTNGELFDTVLDMLNTIISEDTLLKSDFLGHSESDSLMMLDVVISTLIERLDNCVEIVNNKILELLNTIIIKSNGRLSKLSTQLIFKGSLFVCSLYSSRLDWIVSGTCHPVLEDGKDIYAFIVLKQLIKSVTNLAEEFPVEHFLPTTPLSGEEEGDYYNLGYLIAFGESFILVSDIVTDFIDEVMEAVEISKVTETALLATSKKTSTVLSPSFWNQINNISLNLFRSYEVQNAFILFAAICKWSWMELKNTPHGDVPPRHLGSKLFSIESLREFCRLTGTQLKVSKIMGYQVRRLVVSSIFVNMQYSMSQPRIFLKLLQLVSCIWENWREHIRLEFPVLCEQLIIKILQAPTSKMPPLIHLIALIEVMKWFEQPHMLIEMFVNFDMDVVVAADWNIFSHLIRAVCSFAEKASRPTIPGGPSGPFPSEVTSVGSISTMFGVNYIPIQPRDVKIKALEVIATITRAMMDATGHANLIYMDVIAHDESSSDFNNNNNNDNESDDDDGNNNNLDGDTISSLPPPSSLMKRRISYSITNRRAISLQSAELLQQAIKIYQEKESVGKAVKFLVSKNFMSDTPHEIAGFVRIYKDSFDPASIGDFLGEGGRNKKEEEYWDAIRYRYTRAVSFVDLHVYDALRLYLTGCGFRMPGEAQKIDRFISAFVKVYWQDNRGTEFCPFGHEDTVHLLAYAIIMLNTDLHRANIDKKKGGKKMTKVDFIKNLRGADQGNDINSDYLGLIYDDIATTPIEMEVKEQVTSSSTTTGSSTLKDNNESATTDLESHKRYVVDLLKNLRNCGDLMRSLSPYTHMFHIVGVNISISMELVSFMFESVWHHFHAIVDGILTKMNNEENIICSALDVLCNSLTSCIFLNLKVEKLAFATQLARFMQICEAADSATSLSSSSSSTTTTTISSSTNSTTNDLSEKILTSGANFASGIFRQQKWFISVESSTAETAISAIAEVHTLVNNLKATVRKCARREATKVVLSKIEKRANLIDNERFFIMEGDLKKKNRSGKFVQYRFFLFSDCIVYAHQGFSEYKVHGQLNLGSTNIDANVKDDAQNCCFIIENPTKTFVVMTENHFEKQLWVRSINDAISAWEHKSRGRRLSIFDRVESQEKVVTERQILRESMTTKTSRQSGRVITSQLSSGSNGLKSVPESESSPQSGLGDDDNDNDDDRLSLFQVQQRLPFQDVSTKNENTDELNEIESLELNHHDPMISEKPLNINNDNNNRKEIEGPHFINEWITEEDLEHDKYETTESNKISDDSSISSPQIPPLSPPTPLRTTQSTDHDTVNSSSNDNDNDDNDNEQDELKHRIQTCSLYLSKLDSKSLVNVFLSGLRQWKILLDSKVVMQEAIKLKLYGLYRLVKDGAASASDDSTISIDSVQYKQLKAWRDCGNMSTSEAQSLFIVTLYSICPDWEYTLN